MNISKGLERLGEQSINTNGYNMTIINYRNCCDIDIEFEKGNIIYNVNYLNFKKGYIRNPLHPSVYGTGYIGIGDYVACYENKTSKVYYCWNGMFKRCYSVKTQERQPTYIGCSVAEEWHNFQNFANWMEQNYNPEIMQGWHLDKDILFKDNKIYSAETCCFVPNEINILFNKRKNNRGIFPIGVSKRNNNKYVASIDKKYYLTPIEAFEAYKTAKEQYIKEVANKWRSQITEEVYNALINYKVEIDD